jgi:uncharacterized glyoxalase superfamily protein PhnB
MIKKLTPVLYVEAIEPCLDLWVDRLGFAKQVEVPEGDRIGFVILAKNGVEIMYQSRASVAKDVPAFAKRSLGQTNLYVEVGDLAAIEQALEGMKLVLPRRTTFYGATEIGVQDAAGNVIVFAEMGAETPL